MVLSTRFELLPLVVAIEKSPIDAPIEITLHIVVLSLNLLVVDLPTVFDFLAPMPRIWLLACRAPRECAYILAC